MSLLLLFQGGMAYTASVAETLSISDTLNKPTGSSTYVSTVLSDNPILYWQLNETSGNIAYDTSTSSISGIYGSGITYNTVGSIVPNVGGQNNSFPSYSVGNNANNIVSTPINTAIQPASAVSLEFWMYLTSTSAVTGATSPFLAGYGSDSACTPYGVFISPGTGYLGFQFSLSGNGCSYPNSTTVINPNTLYHVVLTVNSASAILYLNGVNIFSESGLAGNQLYYGSGDSIGGFIVNGEGGNIDAGCGGTYAHVAIYPTALSSSRVLAHYNTGLTSDFSSRLIGANRTSSESLTVTDASIRQVSDNRTSTDTISSSDSVTRIDGINRSNSETLTVSDTILRINNQGRSISESNAEADIISGSQILGRTVSDVYTASDLVSSVYHSLHNANYATPSETFSISDFLSQTYPSTYVSTVLADGPILYWQLNETSGNVAHDTSTSGISGLIGNQITMGTPGIVNNVAGTAMTFPSYSTPDPVQYQKIVQTPVNSILEPATTVSLEFWVTLYSLSNYPFLVAYGSDANYTPYGVWLSGTNGQLGFEIAGTSYGSYPLCSQYLNTNTLYHIVLAVNPASAILYLNGVSVYSGPGYSTYGNGNIGYAGNDTGGFVVGGEGGNVDSAPNASYAHVAIYPTMLSANRVLAHYNTGIQYLTSHFSRTMAETASASDASTRSYAGARTRSETFTITDTAANMRSQSTALASAVLADNPIVYYRMNEPVGSTIMFDSSSSALPGIITSGVTPGSACLVTGGDTSFVFPGGSDSTSTNVVQVSPVSALMLSGAQTIEFWFKCPLPFTGSGNNYTMYTQSSNHVAFPLFINLVDSNNSYVPNYFIQAQIQTATANYTVYPNILSANTTYHFAMTYDGTTLKAYINGVLSTSTPASGTLVDFSSPYTYSTFGGAFDPGHTPYTGLMSNVAIYGTALASSRIAAHYTAGTTANNFLRYPSESLSVADSNTHQRYVTRSNSEALAISDTVSKAHGATQNLSEAFSISDALTRYVNELRSLTESQGVSDSGTRNVTTSRVQYEYLAHSDTSTRQQINARSMSENYSLSDAVLRVFGSVRNAIESGIFVDSVGRLHNLVVNASENLTASDTANRVQNSNRTVSETISVSDVIQRVLGEYRNAGESLTVSDLIGRVIANIYSASESLSISDSSSRILGANRSSNETATIADSIARVLASMRLASEGLAITDSVSEVQNHLRNMVETLTNTDVVSRLLNSYRMSSENQSVADSIATQKQFIRSTLDAISTFTDIVVRTLYSVRNSLELMTVSDNAQEQKAFLRAIADSAASSDAVARLMQTHRTSSEALSQTDAVNRIYNSIRSSVENGAISDSAFKQHFINVLAQEIMTANDALNLLRTLHRTTADAMSVADASARSVHRSRAIQETLTYLDNLYETLVIAPLVITISSLYFTNSAQMILPISSPTINVNGLTFVNSITMNLAIKYD